MKAHRKYTGGTGWVSCICAICGGEIQHGDEVVNDGFNTSHQLCDWGYDATSEDDLEAQIFTLSGNLEAAINDGRWLAVAELERQIRSLNAQINV